MYTKSNQSEYIYVSRQLRPLGTFGDSFVVVDGRRKPLFCQSSLTHELQVWLNSVGLYGVQFARLNLIYHSTKGLNILHRFARNHFIVFLDYDEP